MSEVIRRRLIRHYFYWRDWGIGIEIGFRGKGVVAITIGPLVIEIGDDW